MRITGNHALRVSEYAHEISGGKVAVCGIGGDIGHGARVMDGNTQLSWYGQPRLATAYYIGQVDALREVHGTTTDLPADVEQVRTELLESDRRTAVMSWYASGLTDGRYRAGVSRERRNG